jgi:predicted AAA+ superfamily ATPase
MAYRRRVLDDALDELFPQLAAIAIEGAKGVGKTATASQRAATTLDLTDPNQRRSVADNYNLVAQVRPPVLIDEWQLEPSVWDRVRKAVDDDATGGRFLLTGSAAVGQGVRIHSGAGRIVSFKLRPMSLTERGLAIPTVSLRSLLQGGLTPIEGSTDVDLPQYVDEILRSGFPAIRELAPAARAVQLDGYIARIVERELPENDMAVRRPAALRRWLVAYAAATAGNAAYSTILDAATPGESDKPARQTVAGYREQLTRLFVLDPVDAWLPAFSPLTRLTKTPKHHLVDPALAARLVGVGRNGLLRGDGQRTAPRTDTKTWLGSLFESLAVQSVRVYAQAANATVGHLRTQNTDQEIDIIVEGPDRRVVALEVKLSTAPTSHDVRHLNWLHDQIGNRLADRVCLTTGPHAYRRDDGIAVVPLTLLGP